MRKQASPDTGASSPNRHTAHNLAFDITGEAHQAFDGCGESSLGKQLYELCSEIAIAIIRRNLSDDDSAVIRSEIRSGLVEHLSCSTNHANSLIDLSLELIHLKAYGTYRRSELQLTLLIAEAGGQFRDEQMN